MRDIYLTYFQKNLKAHVAYKFNAVLDFISSGLVLLAKVVVWKALYGNTEVINGMPVDITVFFAAASTVVSSMMGTKIGERLGDNIRNGRVAVDFVRPVKTKCMYLAEDAALIFATVIGSVLMAGLVLIFYNVTGGAGIEIRNIGIFCITLCLACILNYQLAWVLGLTGFWLETSWHIRWITSAMVKAFSGNVVPLWFCPTWMRNIAKILPYRYIFYDPIMILIGRNDFEIWQIAGVQIGWILVLTFIERIVWRNAQKRVFVQGG